MDPVISTFNGECSVDEIMLHAKHLESKSVDCLIAIGGGKCVDAGKCIAYRLGVPVAIVPTLASNDAPCSALSVLYTPEGVASGVEFFPDSPALVVVDTENIVEANTLLSGLGFEGGGLAVAHGIAGSYTAVPVVHDNYLHGEMVAMGTLTQLVMESREEARQVAKFFAEVGLPIHLGQLSLSTDDKDALTTAAEATMDFPFIGNMPLALTSESILEFIIEAHELGLAITQSVGDTAYRRLHGVLG